MLGDLLHAQSTTRSTELSWDVYKRGEDIIFDVIQCWFDRTKMSWDVMTKPSFVQDERRFSAVTMGIATDFDPQYQNLPRDVYVTHLAGLLEAEFTQKFPDKHLVFYMPLQPRGTRPSGRVALSTRFVSIRLDMVWSEIKEEMT